MNFFNFNQSILHSNPRLINLERQEANKTMKILTN